MADTTPIFGFPFPEDTDPTDVPGDMEALALAIETDLDTVSDGLAAHLADTTDAHDASAISITALAGIVATNVQAALAELIAEAFPVGWGAWTAYTPTFSGTLGNGTLTGKYVKIGRLVHFAISFTWGSTTSHGAGAAHQYGLPVTATSGTYVIGGARIVDASPSAQYFRCVFVNSTTAVAMASEAAQFVTNATPMTWATGDTLTITGSYESAA